ncbi:MAG: dUTP diphosphatase [Candidatus Woesearchaeota archaeon]
MVEVQILRMDKNMTMPFYANEGDAGIDLRSSVDEIIKPNETKTIPTGIKMAIPENYVGLIWDKSGYASKNSIKTMAGVVDSGYRGEIKVVLINLGKEDFIIKKDMKIAQILIQPVVRANLKEVSELNETKRNTGGFGSTGKF